MLNQSDILTAIACLAFSIILFFGITIAALLKKKYGITQIVLEMICLDALCLSFLYFNASVPTASKIGDIEFVNPTDNADTIESLQFTPEDRKVTIQQGDDTIKTDYAMVDGQTLRFISPVDKKSYLCELGENKFEFWTQKDVSLSLVDQNTNADIADMVQEANE